MGKKHTSNKVIVETILATGMSHKDAAALFNVSTRWIRELIHRYRTGGYQALEPRSRRPHSNPRQVPESTVKTILDIRQHLENTGQDNGAHTIRWHLQQQKITPLPAASTIHRILKRHGWVIEQPHKRPRSSWKRFQADQPNETWQLDYSHWYLNNNQRVAILTIIDDHSRFVIACKAFEHETGTNVIDTFISAGNKHGFPKSTLTDNGRAFTTSTDRTNPARNGFEQLLIDLGIKQKNGKPYHPQTQGKVERFHYTLKLALASKIPAQSLDELNSQLKEIIEYYNHKRPHRALNRTTPAEAYTALPKALPADIKPDHDYRLRTDKVGTNGKTTLRWGGKLRRLYIGRRWGGEPITMVCIDNRVSIKITTTGAQIAAYTLAEEKIYYNKKDNELDPQQGN